MTAALPAPAPARMPTTCDFGFDRLRPTGAGPGREEAFLLALGAAAAAEGGRAARVSAVIDLAWQAPEGAAPLDPMRLSIVDRVAALFGTAFRVGHWPAEFVARCEGCGAPNLMRVAPQEFAYRPGAGAVERNGQRYMQPNGHHETALAQGQDLSATLLALAPGAAGPEPPDAEILAALEAAGPGFDTDLAYRCPSCGAANRFWFDPLDWIVRQGRGVLLEVHRLARAYGWTEAEILALPRARRQAYLALIEAGT